MFLNTNIRSCSPCDLCSPLPSQPCFAGAWLGTLCLAQETGLDCKHVLTVAIGNFISTTKSISAFVCMQRRKMGRREDTLDPEAAFGSAGTAPV